jgi:uncharacterized protein YjbJ (UPF0337 family)
MNKDTLAGQWRQLKGDAKVKWSKLTDDDLGRVAGNYDKLVGALQERYGYLREQAMQAVDDWTDAQKPGEDTQPIPRRRPSNNL